MCQFHCSTGEKFASGFTLVEMMVVVAILGILVALAIGAYSSQLDKGRITQMKELAMEVEKGQTQYASRNGRYFDPDNSKTMYKAKNDYDQWEQLLEFDRDSMNPDIRVMTDAGVEGGSCSFCGSQYTPDTSENWYAIQVCRDLDGNQNNPGTDCSNDTTVYLDNQLAQPAVLREGK